MKYLIIIAILFVTGCTEDTYSTSPIFFCCLRNGDVLCNNYGAQYFKSDTGYVSMTGEECAIGSNETLLKTVLKESITNISGASRPDTYE